MITTERQRDAFLQGQEALEKAIKAIDLVLHRSTWAFEVRAGLGFLSEIIGVSTTEDIWVGYFLSFVLGNNGRFFTAKGKPGWGKLSQRGKSARGWDGYFELILAFGFLFYFRNIKSMIASQFANSRYLYV